MEVLFDLDGVLLRSWQFRVHLVEEYGITPEQTRPFFSGPFERCSVGEGDLYESLRPFLPQWNWPGSIESFVSTWFACDGEVDERAMQFADALRSSGVGVHIASTQERHRASYLMNKLELGRLFDSVHFSCDVGAAKPDAAFYRGVEERLSASPNELLLVDDAMENVESALELGWQAIHYAGFESLAEIPSGARPSV